MGGRGKPYGSSTNVLNYKSGGELVDCQVGLQSGPPSWKCNGSQSKMEKDKNGTAIWLDFAILTNKCFLFSNTHQTVISHKP